MFDWCRRIFRAKPRAAPVATARPEPAPSRLGERCWTLWPSPRSDVELICAGYIGEPWQGLIVWQQDNLYGLRPKGEPGSSPWVNIREDNLYPTAEAARDAYILAMGDEVERWTPAVSEPDALEHQDTRPQAPRATIDRVWVQPNAPSVGGRYWLIAPIDDTLNLGYGIRSPWRGVVVRAEEDAYCVVPEEDAPDGIEPMLGFWRDAWVRAAGLHETADNAWVAYHEAKAEERARAERHRSRWARELARWIQAREDGLPRPPRSE